MMGVGKSTIGKRLSKRLNIKFIDIDRSIEIKEKKTIRKIFEEYGESYFREIEKEISLNVLKKRNQVVALGGGAFINPLIRKEIKRSSLSIWLDLSVKLLLQRLKNIKKRPLLDGENLSLSINKIYSERKKFYNQSDFRIKCDTLEINQITNKIIKMYDDQRDKS